MAKISSYTLSTVTSADEIIIARSGASLKLNLQAAITGSLSGAVNFTSIGATTPGSGAFTTLTASGDITAQSAVIINNVQGLQTAGGRLLGVSDGVWRFTNAAVDGFTGLILGTNDASGIRIKKTGTTFNFRRGDDLADADITALTVTAGINEIVIAATAILTAEQCRGSQINNFGQTAANTLTLPAAAQGLNGIIQISTSGMGAVHLKAGASDKIYLDGVALDDADKASLASPAVGDWFSFRAFKTGASAYDWIVTSGTGTLTDGGA